MKQGHTPEQSTDARSARLGRLLQPQNIAVVGGGSWCANVITACDAIGYRGEIWPVHPHKSDIAGRTAYAALDLLPQPPDATFLGINRHATIEAMAHLNTFGAGGAVCFASGFAEAEAELAGGADLQNMLVTAAGDMPFLGPNCYGFLNYLDGAALWPDQHGGVRVDSGVAIITQSSNIALNLTMQTQGLPIAYMVTAGNQARVDICELGAQLLRDTRVSCLGLHIEGINNLRQLEQLSHLSHQLEKPVCVLKVGSSSQAQLASISHTASLSGSAQGAQALFKRLGISQCGSLSVFLNILAIWHTAGPLRDTALASASCSGGEASLMADVGQSSGVDFPALTTAQTTALADALGPKVALANPLDYHTYIWGDQAAMTATFTALFSADISLGIVVLDFPRADRCDQSEWDPVLDAIIETAQAVTTQIAVLSSLPSTLPEPIAQRLITEGILPLAGIDSALAAVALAQKSVPHPDPILLPRSPEDVETIHEYEAKQVLERFGAHIPNSLLAHTPAKAAQALKTLSAPVAVKGVGLAHKSDTGAVKLNLQTPDEIHTATANINSASYIIEEMVENCVQEILLAVTLDPTHGYILTLGAGGTATELLDDTTSLVLPVTSSEIEAALLSLKCGPILTGYRGAPSASIEAICAAVKAVEAYVVAHHGQVQEVEINPLICTPTSAVVADALIVKGQLS